MLPNPQKQRPAGGRVDAEQKHNGFHANHASAEPLLQRLEGVQKSGTGWRARCPACGGKSKKLSVAESHDRVLVHCFSCNDAEAVLVAVGLRWSDLQPPRNWPESEEEQRQRRQALRMCGWAAALEVLRIEAMVIRLAAIETFYGRDLGGADLDRLALACGRIEGAAFSLIEPKNWRHDDCYAPKALAQLKRRAADELRRQHADAERAAQRAEAAALEAA